MAETGAENGEVGHSDGFDMTEVQFLEAFSAQLLASGVPQHLWASVYNKINEETYDIGQFVVEVQEQFDDAPTDYGMMLHREKGLKARDATSVFLVDHAWTFELKDARRHLEAVPSLLQRVCSLTSVDLEAEGTQQAIHLVMRRIWKYLQTYKIRTTAMDSREVLPVWYLTDEVGSKLRHSHDPNCRMVPFSTAHCTYSLLWPLRDVSKDEELTIDRVHVHDQSDKATYLARALPWVTVDLTHIPFTQTEPPVEYFEKFRVSETLPDPNMQYKPPTGDRKLRVFVQYQNFAEFLTDERFEIVDSPEDSDICWIMTTFKDFEELSLNHPGRHINQFPCEMLLTVKDLMAIVARRAPNPNQADALALGPTWLPTTFNLETEMPQFVSYYQTLEERGEDNTWICKPWNLARGMDITITDDINCIVRLPETGPKVACKYIHDPVLFYRPEIGKVKMDIRYIVLLSSAQPLKLYAYRVFWLRFANIAYSLDNFHEYEKHFTVMNYIPTNLKQVHYDEFIPMFEEQYPDFPWNDVEGSIFEMLRELFEAATTKPPPQGLGHSLQSRAMYAVDLMLKWDKSPSGEKIMVPQICEVNFCPDCERACKYHPFFVNDVFSTLFFDDTEGKHVQLISK